MNIGGSNFYQDRLNLASRIEYHAMRGATRVNLRIYHSQENQLIRDGFSIQRLASNVSREFPGQNLCTIGWRHAVEGTKAYEMLMISAENNKTLAQQLADNTEEEHFKIPYEV